MLFDSHLHTRYSFDAGMTLDKALQAAQEMGLNGFCITEHVDFDETINMEGYRPAPVAEYYHAYHDVRDRSRKEGLLVRLGLEIALKDEKSDAATRDWIGDVVPDFFIGSCHNTDVGDPYEDEYYLGRKRDEAYGIYLNNILQRIQSCDWFHVLGHYDYVAKHAPYVRRAVSYEDGPEVFDEIFRTLIRRGQGLEVNTSAQRDTDKALWGFDVLQRYVQLGGEFVTFGSDAHAPAQVGFRLKEAKQLAREAGVRYQAVFTAGKPEFFPL